jgi:hypothetical protein
MTGDLKVARMQAMGQSLVSRTASDAFAGGEVAAGAESEPQDLAGSFKERSVAEIRRHRCDVEIFAPRAREFAGHHS